MGHNKKYLCLKRFNLKHEYFNRNLADKMLSDTLCLDFYMKQAFIAQTMIDHLPFKKRLTLIPLSAAA